MQRVAKCCCGSLSIIVDGDPQVQGICHCDNCKKRTGSAFGWSAYFKNDQVIETTGDSDQFHITGENKQTRHFCKNCGTTLFWTAAVFDGMTGIAGGCFVDDPLPEPSLTVSNGGKLCWLGLPTNWKQNF